ncbi:hypothetical protein [Nonomuraea roseola]|uniref:Solute-binding protein family 5 domain-containing protein n=1 Tax=Nonomuraea roseola TaxID=46179 RepID=A0ABV5PVP8_9ACTN
MLYAVPFDAHPMVQYSNTDLAEKAGLLGADGRLAPTEGEEGVCDPNTDYGASVAAFQNGQAAFLRNGDWETTTFKLAKTPFSMARFPAVRFVVFVLFQRHIIRGVAHTGLAGQ